jgi:hypothetical protein
MSLPYTILVPAVLAIYVTYLFLRNKDRITSDTNPNTKEILNLKANAEVVLVNFDHCQFKDSSFLQEYEQSNPDYKLAGHLVGSSIGHIYTPVVREETVQSVIFYQDPSFKGGKRFYQTFPFDVTTLKYYVITNRLQLYIHKKEIDKYFFEILKES